jgi:hypothetical protein
MLMLIWNLADNAIEVMSACRARTLAFISFNLVSLPSCFNSFHFLSFNHSLSLPSHPFTLGYTIHNNMVSHKVNDESAESDYGDSIPLDSLTDKLIQNEGKSDYGESIPLDPTTDNLIQHLTTNIEETPFTKFRSGTLNVSDFIDPQYCEYKVSFTI